MLLPFFVYTTRPCLPAVGPFCGYLPHAQHLLLGDWWRTSVTPLVLINIISIMASKLRLHKNALFCTALKALINNQSSLCERRKHQAVKSIENKNLIISLLRAIAACLSIISCASAYNENNREAKTSALFAAAMRHGGVRRMPGRHARRAHTWASAFARACLIARGASSPSYGVMKEGAATSMVKA